jgi:hypothetical protein
MANIAHSYQDYLVLYILHRLFKHFGCDTPEALAAAWQKTAEYYPIALLRTSTQPLFSMLVYAASEICLEARLNENQTAT